VSSPTKWGDTPAYFIAHIPQMLYSSNQMKVSQTMLLILSKSSFFYKNNKLRINEDE
jgi:hypothetical protein